MVGNPMVVITLIVQTRTSGIIGIWKWISIINEKGTMEYYIPSHSIIFNMDLLNISYKIIFYEEKGCTISTRNKRKKK